MKLKYIFLFSAALLMGTSCADFLDKTPISDNVDGNFFTAENQLEPYCNNMYSLLPDHGTGTGTFGYFTTDNNSDDMTAVGQVDNFLPQRVQVPSSGSYDSFSTIRTCNLFLQRTAENLENGTLSNDDNVKHYIGEMYFFRAYVYFSLLKTYGDFPIVTEVLTDGDYAANVEANKRKPRNEVARFILSDLDKAAQLMADQNMSTNRINRDVALLLKSRVALYEATWLKYFKGTAFVPNGEGWPGATRAYNQGYEFPSGNIDNEIQWFLDQAIEASALVADKHTLTENTGVIMQGEGDSNPYTEQFSVLDMSGYDEILLWRDFDYGKGIVHNRPTDASTNCAGVGLTRSLIQSYLMNDGLPYYASSLYQGDNSSQDIVANRDDRIRLFLKQPGMINIWLNVGQGTHGVPVEPQLPDIINGSYTLRYNTGYQSRKYWYWDHAYCNNWQGETGVPIFRAAEAYLNYIEAYYERYGRLDSKADQYWRTLRRRARIDEDYNKTIQATDMAKEAELDWAAYSGGKILSDVTLFNIRRERRNEFLEEGFRYTDLCRWRSMDQMLTKKYHIEGMKLWNTDLPERYAAAGYNLIYNQDPESNVSSPALSDYLRPYEILKNNRAYEGYGWHMAHYLSPIAMQHFMITSTSDPDNYSDSPIYQNPYWPVKANYSAEK